MPIGRQTTKSYRIKNIDRVLRQMLTELQEREQLSTEEIALCLVNGIHPIMVAVRQVKLSSVNLQPPMLRKRDERFCKRVRRHQNIMNIVYSNVNYRFC